MKISPGARDDPHCRSCRARGQLAQLEGTKARAGRPPILTEFCALPSAPVCRAAKVFRYHLASVRPAMGYWDSLDHRGEW